MNKRTCITFLLVFFLCAAHAQEKKYVYQDTALMQQDDAPVVASPVEDEAVDTKTEDKTDTTLYFNKLKVSPDTVEGWKNARAFAYARYLDSLLKAKQMKEELKKPESTAPSGPSWLDRVFASPVTKVVFWSLAAVFILFILYRLFLAQGIFRGKTASKNTEQPTVTEEVITAESDFDVMIRQALQAGNYRLAVRYLYLQTLHKLADKKLVELAVDKTNYQYVQEIGQPALRNDFASLTLSYEYVWYGEFMIDNSIYHQIENGFTGFNRKI